MTKILRNLRIDDVSSVDVGAGKGVRVVLRKRDTNGDTAREQVRKWRDGVPLIYVKPLAFASDLPAAALAYLKREFTQAERDARAESGHALPDGSFPIDNKEDLHNAIQAIGRAKNPAKAKAHIKARAAALDAEDALPDDWSKRDVGKAGNEDEARDAHGRWTSGSGQAGGGRNVGGSNRNIGRGMGGMVRRTQRNQAKFPVGSTARDHTGRTVTVTGHSGPMIETDSGSYHDSKLHKAADFDIAATDAEGVQKFLARYAPEITKAIEKRAGEEATVLRQVADGVEKVVKAAVDFTEAIQASDDVQDATDLMCDVRDAVCALDCSINSILCDEDVADKPAAITTSYEQFKAYIGGLVLEDDDDADNTEKREMSEVTALNPAIKKILEEALAKALGPKDAEIAKLAAQVAYFKMKKEHQAYHDGLGSDEAKRKFTAMTDDERDDEMSKTRKRAEDDPIYKAMRVENDDLRKRLTAIEDERALDIAKRDAKEMGLTQNDAGEVLMKMRRGDAEAIKTYEGYMVALAKSKTNLERTSKVFDEFGTGRGNDGTKGDSANTLLMAKAQELRTKNPSLTEAQAFEKVYLDPANRDLMEREGQERMAKIHGRAA